MAFCLPWVVTHPGLAAYRMYLGVMYQTIIDPADRWKWCICGSEEQYDVILKKTTYYYNVLLTSFSVVAVIVPFIGDGLPMKEQSSIPTCWFHRTWVQLCFAAMPALIGVVILVLYGVLTIKYYWRYILEYRRAARESAQMQVNNDGAAELGIDEQQGSLTEGQRDRSDSVQLLTEGLSSAVVLLLAIAVRLSFAIYGSLH